MTHKRIGKGGKKRKKSKGQNDSSEKPSKVQQNTTHNDTLTTNNNDTNVNKDHTKINSSKSESVKPGTMYSFIPNNESPIAQHGRQNFIQYPMQQIPNPNITQASSTTGYYVGLNSVRREILSSVTIVFYDKVRGRNKAQR